MCATKKAAPVLEHWVKDHAVHMPKVEFFPSSANKKDTRYWLYHRRKSHILEQCVSLKESSIRRTKMVSLSLSFLKNNDKGKSQDDASYVEIEIEGDE